MPDLYGPTGPEYRLFGEHVTLEVRQQPEHALVTQTGKEKGRKPVDPPPIVQMNVTARYDPSRNWLCSPHVFMFASPLEGAEGDTVVPKEKVVGQQVSSLHRLKDINDEDGGFFVFGDISLRSLGTHRLKFDLYNLEAGSAVFLVSVISKPFEVVSNKDFKGLSESSHLSRTFSDQGVRLRLRKEPRSLGGGVKRAWQSPEESSTTQRPSTAYSSGGPVPSYTYSGTGSVKRQRTDTDHTTSNHYPQFHTTRTSYTGTPLGSTAAWADQGQHSYLGGHTAGGANYMPLQSYNLAGAPLQWQRGGLAVQTGNTGQMIYSNPRRGSEVLGSPYFSQPPQYVGASRPQTQQASSTYPDLGDFNTSNALPETSQSHNYIPSSSDYTGQLNTTALSTEQQGYQQSSVQTTPVSKWTADSSRLASTNPSTGLYSSAPHSDSAVSGLQYSTISQPPTAQYPHSSQQSAVQTPYSGIPRISQQYPHSSGTMTNASIPGITNNLFSTAADTDWAGYSPHDSAATQLTDQALAQHQQQQQQQSFTTSQNSWSR